MPVKSKGPAGKTQADNARAAKKKASAHQKTVSRQLTTEQRELQAAHKRHIKELDRQLKADMKYLQHVGLYAPKSLELTPYRRRTVAKKKQEHRDVFAKDRKGLSDLIFVKAPPKQSRKLRAKAGDLQMKTSRTGIFVKRDGHVSAVIKHDKKHDEFFIERRGKTKTGKNTGRRYKDQLPIASLDELDKERDRLRRAFSRMKLKGNEVLAFRVSEFGLDGFSHDTFVDVEQLLNHLDKYQKTPAAKLNFFRHIIIEKSESISRWHMDHPIKEHNARNRQKLPVGRGKFSTRASKG